MAKCETILRTYQPFRLGLGDGCVESKTRTNTAEVEVTVRKQGKMKLCNNCLPHFRKYAQLPFTVRKLKLSAADLELAKKNEARK